MLYIKMDILALEELKNRGFIKTVCVVLISDRPFYKGRINSGIYKYFRQGYAVYGDTYKYKPTGEVHNEHTSANSRASLQKSREKNRLYSTIILRGITINRGLIKAAMDVLNDSPEKTLPQNCRNDIRAKTPEGLDRRIKDYLDTDLRTANIISDVLAEVGVVELLHYRPSLYQSGRHLKDTDLY